MRWTRRSSTDSRSSVSSGNENNFPTQCILVFLYWKTDICNIKLSQKFLSFYKGTVRCTAFLVLYYFIEFILPENNENVVHLLFPYKTKETFETDWYLHARKNRESNINRIWLFNASKFPIAILRYYYSKRSKILNEKNETFTLELADLSNALSRVSLKIPATCGKLITSAGKITGSGSGRSRDERVNFRSESLVFRLSFGTWDLCTRLQVYTRKYIDSNINELPRYRS